MFQQLPHCKNMPGHGGIDGNWSVNHWLRRLDLVKVNTSIFVDHFPVCTELNARNWFSELEKIYKCLGDTYVESGFDAEDDIPFEIG